jgi:hypothetical protein
VFGGQLAGVQLRRLDLAAALEAARRAFDAAQRRRREAFVAEAEAAAAKELAVLVAATDVLVEKWQAFFERSQARDAAFYDTAPLNTFQMARFSPMAFTPLVGSSAEPSQWSAFRARVTAGG